MLKAKWITISLYDEEQMKDVMIQVDFARAEVRIGNEAPIPFGNLLMINAAIQIGLPGWKHQF